MTDTAPTPTEVVVSPGVTVYRGGQAAGFGPGQTVQIPSDVAASLISAGHVTTSGTSGS